MPNFGMIGKTYTQTFSVSLPVWSASNPVGFISTSAAIMPVKTPRHPHVGSILHPVLFLTLLDTTASKYKIVEVTSKFGTIQSMKVRLYHRATGQLIQEKTSQLNGVIEFVKLSPLEWYTLVALDDEGIYNADVLDLKRPLI